MDTKRIALIAAMGLMSVVIFTQVKKLGTPAPQVVQQPEKVVEKVKYVGVLAASQDLPLGSRIGEESFSWIDWPAEAVTPALITEDNRPDAKSELADSIVRSPIVEGEPVNLVKLIDPGNSGVMAALLKPGMRAVTTGISVDTAAGGFIQPGDRVDVILRESFRINYGEDEENKPGIRRDTLYEARTLFEDVRVLAIDQTYSNTPEGGATVIGSTATFELNQEDAETLQEAEGAGDIYLTLRGITRSGAKSRSARAQELYDEKTSSGGELTIYRSGQATRVAIQER